MKKSLIFFITSLILESCFIIKANQLQRNGIYEINCFEKSLVDLSLEFNQKIENNQGIEKKGRMSNYQIVDVRISNSQIKEIIWYKTKEYKPTLAEDLYIKSFKDFLLDQKLTNLKFATESEKFTVRIELKIDSCGYIFMSGEYLKGKVYHIKLNQCPFDPNRWLEFVD